MTLAQLKVLFAVRIKKTQVLIRQTEQRDPLLLRLTEQRDPSLFRLTDLSGTFYPFLLFRITDTYIESHLKQTTTTQRG